MSLRPIKRRRVSKGQAESIHTRRRAAERYGINLNRDARRAIVKMMQERGQDFEGERQSNNRTIFTLPYEGTLMKVVYDKARHCLVTVLPLKETHA